ncbi:hypothetical protein J2W23_001460 [Variovorax boronicumulans]|nr:hypothetical protein [Variovorax boronicumulans]
MAALSYSAPGVRPDNDLLGRDKPMDRTSLSQQQ